MLGIVLFVSGFVINYWADSVFAQLSNSFGHKYKIPHGGLFNVVAAPHYLGEIIEWCAHPRRRRRRPARRAAPPHALTRRPRRAPRTGFAVITASFPGVAFATFTACNLVPRALHHHKWNHQRWGETYRDLRRNAIFPFVL